MEAFEKLLSNAELSAGRWAQTLTP
jgi:hypothetical protein